jgi:hypothetical protein
VCLGEILNLLDNTNQHTQQNREYWYDLSITVDSVVVAETFGDSAGDEFGQFAKSI